MKRYIIVLNLDKLSVAEKVALAFKIAEAITLNSADFTVEINNQVVIIKTAALNLENAYTQPGKGEDKTINVKKMENALDKVLINVANNVENEINEQDNPGLADKASMQLKKEPLQRGRNYGAFSGKQSGEALLRTKRVAAKSAYVWFYRFDGETQWHFIAGSLEASYTAKNLILGKKYYFGVAPITKDGQQDIIELGSLIIK